MVFQYEQLSLATASVVIDIMADGTVSKYLWNIGKKLSQSLQEIAYGMQIELQVHGPAPRQSIYFPEQRGFSSKRILTFFIQNLFHEGVLCNGNIMSSAAHDDEDLNKTTRAFERSLSAVSYALRNGDPEQKIRFSFDIV